MHTPDPVQLQLYLSSPQACSYLTGRESRTLFPGPQIPMNPALHNVLADLGFRRSGSMVYRHECDTCRACTPIRLPVDRFLPRRIQRRVWRKNRRLSIEIKPADFDTEQFELYGKYLRHRHPDSDMASVSETQYRDFLVCDWCDTRFFEFRLDTELVAVAVTDLLPTGLSAVYTFFDPRWSAMSPGVYAILWQIQEAKRRGLRWLYLGFWIPGSPKMAYKSLFRPLQAYRNETWKEFSIEDPLDVEDAG